jgi:chondroitin AC lyase
MKTVVMFMIVLSAACAVQAAPAPADTPLQPPAAGEPVWRLLFESDYAGSGAATNLFPRVGSWKIKEQALEAHSPADACLLLPLELAGDFKIEVWASPLLQKPYPYSGAAGLSKTNYPGLEIGLCCPASPELLDADGYFASFHSGKGLVLQRCCKQVACSATSFPVAGQRHHLVFCKVGPRIQLTVDDAYTVAYEDPTPVQPTQGRAYPGLYVYNTRTRFERIRVFAGVDPAATSLPVPSLQQGTATPTAAIQTIRERAVVDVLATATGRSTLAEAEALAAFMAIDGSFPDVHYDAVDLLEPEPWSPLAHLGRLRQMAVAWRTAPDASAEARARIRSAVNRGIVYWCRVDPLSTDNHRSRFVVPSSLMDVLLLMGDQLSADAATGARRVLRRATLIGTGYNLVAMANLCLRKAVMFDDAAGVSNAVQALCHEIRIAGKDGIKEDMSFHHHGPLLYNHVYGMGFLSKAIEIEQLCRGTEWQFPGKTTDLLTDLLLDGMLWMTWNTWLDQGARGRQFESGARKANPYIPSMQRLLACNPARAGELQTALSSDERSVRVPAGNRHFWKSDMMVHRRTGYYFSLRMHSMRTLGSEAINAQGLKNHHVADGCTYLLQQGDEYQNIYPAWNWNRIPGTTLLDTDTLEGEVGRPGATTLVGGVSDGQQGAAAMDYRRNGLCARKAWFCFDEAIVCMGAGIRSTRREAVVTTVNQTRAFGDVRVLKGGVSEVLPTGRRVLSKAQAVHHNNVLYEFPRETAVAVESAMRTGDWQSITHTVRGVETVQVCRIEILHGAAPAEATYVYRIQPGVAAAQIPARLWSSADQDILANTETVQAVRDPASKTIAAVFYSAASLSVAGQPYLVVDHPCLLLLKRKADKFQLTVADPCHCLQEVSIHVSERLSGEGVSRQGDGSTVRVRLPAGGMAGQSVSTAWLQLDGTRPPAGEGDRERVAAYRAPGKASLESASTRDPLSGWRL